MITMTEVTVNCTPVFIPHLNPKRHYLICRVIKLMPTRQPDDEKVYDVEFWGKFAEICAAMLKLRTKLNIKGTPKVRRMSWVEKDGTQRTKAQVFIVAHKAELVNPIPIDKNVEFDFRLINTTGRFYNARIWTKEHGFTDQNLVSNVH